MIILDMTLNAIAGYLEFTHIKIIADHIDKYNIELFENRQKE